MRLAASPTMLQFAGRLDDEGDFGGDDEGSFSDPVVTATLELSCGCRYRAHPFPDAWRSGTQVVDRKTGPANFQAALTRELRIAKCVHVH